MQNHASHVPTYQEKGEEQIHERLREHLGDSHSCHRHVCLFAVKVQMPSTAKCLGRVCRLPWDTSLVLTLSLQGLGTLCAPCATAQVPPQQLPIHFLLPAYLPPALECILPYLGDKWPPRRAPSSRAIYLPDMCFPVCFLQP